MTKTLEERVADLETVVEELLAERESEPRPSLEEQHQAMAQRFRRQPAAGGEA